MKDRIDSLDGLRAIAALGVLWIHCWTLHGNPRLMLWKFDLTSFMALGGNGVDFFFVISGFCMYYFYGNKKKFTYSDYWNFIKKRWKRLSPVFYFATLVYILFNWNENSAQSVIPQFLTSVFYLNSISSYNIAGFFWSLGPEWQFYLLIPFLFIFQEKVGFFKTLISLTILMLLIAVIGIVILKTKSDILINQLIFRYFEFVWGIVVAYIIKYKKINLRNRAVWWLTFIFISYFGRLFLSKPVLNLSTEYFNFFKLAGFTIMAVGFGGMVYMSITSKGWTSKLLGNKVMSLLGRISYSFYLWHGLAHVIIGNYIISNIHLTDIRAPLLTFFLSTLILIPVSMISYRVFETPYLYHKKRL